MVFFTYFKEYKGFTSIDYTTPHLFQSLNTNLKEKIKCKYVQFKTGVTGVGVCTLTYKEGLTFCKDLATSSLRAHGYKTLFCVALGPVMQVIAVPLYVLGNGTKIAKLGISISSVGANIMKGQMGIAEWSWLACDFALFGERCSALDNFNFMLLRNETQNDLLQNFKEIGGFCDGE